MSCGKLGLDVVEKKEDLFDSSSIILNWIYVDIYTLL